MYYARSQNIRFLEYVTAVCIISPIFNQFLDGVSLSLMENKGISPETNESIPNAVSLLATRQISWCIYSCSIMAKY